MVGCTLGHHDTVSFWLPQLSFSACFVGFPLPFGDLLGRPLAFLFFQALEFSHSEVRSKSGPQSCVQFSALPYTPNPRNSGLIGGWAPGHGNQGVRNVLWRRKAGVMSPWLMNLATERQDPGTLPGPNQASWGAQYPGTWARAWQDSSKAAPIRCSLDPWKNS